MTTYTVFSSNDSGNATSGLSLESAAIELLTADGYRWEIRPSAPGVPGFDLWISQFSESSTLGGRPLVRSVFSSHLRDRAAAETAIFDQVVCDDWHGMEAMTDDAFARMQAELKGEDE